jgi:hypothetical protein
VHDDTGVTRQIAGAFVVDRTVIEQLVDHRALALEFDDAGPAVVPGQFVAVFVGIESDDGGLEAQGEVLGHDGDVVALCREVAGHGEDAMVVAVAGQRLGQRAEVLMVDFDPKGSSLVIDGEG